MPILIDISQIAIANIMMSPDIKNVSRDTNLIKHMIFNSLRLYNSRFRDEYGNMVICVDNDHYWRKDYFPHYKWSRKKSKENSALDWTAIYKTIEATLHDLKTYFPYKYIDVHGAEADDVIAVLAKHSDTPTLIVSGDKDYKQLHKYNNVKQFSPRKKEFVEVENPKIALQELILEGDDSDGIPNIKSDSNCFVVGKRQSPMYKKDVAIWATQEPIEYCKTTQMLENYNRNKTLIDFDCIPKDVEDRILEAYKIEPTANKSTVMTYFLDNQMALLLPFTGDF